MTTNADNLDAEELFLLSPKTIFMPPLIANSISDSECKQKAFKGYHLPKPIGQKNNFEKALPYLSILLS